MKERIKQNPLKYFWPHQKNCDGKNCHAAQITYEDSFGKKYTIRGCPQAEFINSLSDTSAYFGANRSGKTTAGSVKVGYLTTGLYPNGYKGRRFNRATKGRVFAQDFSKLAEVVIEALEEWLPKDCIVDTKKNNVGVKTNWSIKHKSGETSLFDICSYEQKSDILEGWSGDWIWFDEPPPRSIWIASVRGLVDTQGISFFTLTPLKEPWLFDEIYNSKDKKISSVLCDIRHNLERMNPLSHQIIGLKEEAIRNFETKLTEEERETRLHGKFRYLAGRVWKEWDRDIHTFDRSQWVKGKNNVVVDGQPPNHWPRIMLIDPHDRNPHALLWVACDETENFWAYREGWLENCLIEEAAAHIKKVEMEAKERVQMRIMDPNFGPKRYANRGLTVRDEFEQAARKLNYPIRFSFGDDHKELGRKSFASLLKFDSLKPLSLLNHPKFRMASDMKEAIHQIEHYIWDEFKGVTDRDPKEQPKDVNTHFPDLFCYFSLSNFGWYTPKIHEGVGAYYL